MRLAEAKEMSGGLRQSDVMLVDMLQERPRSDLQEGHFSDWKKKQSDTFMNWLEAEQGSLEYSNISNNI